MAGRVTMNHGNIYTFLHDPSGPVHRMVSSKVRKTDAIAAATSPFDEGHMRNGRRSGVRDEGTRLVGYVEFPGPALFHAKGTGIYGPRGRRITPKKAKALVFRVNGQLVFAKSVRGIRPNPWLVKALETGAAPWPVTVH